MPNYILKDEILSPESVKTLEYKGSNTSSLLKLIPDLMKESFRLESTRFFEDEIKWDTSADPTEFYASWRGKDKKDARTTVWCIIRLQGRESKKDKAGSVTVWIRGNILTEFPYSNILHKGIVWLYIRTLYAEQRRKYISEAKRNLESLENEIRKTFELLERGG